MDQFPYVYFVSYAHQQGHGRLEVRLRTPITTIDHIFEVERIIREHNGMLVPVVLSYQLLRGPKVVEG